VHGRQPPSGSSIAVRYRDAGARSSVVQQQGRVLVDADVNEQRGHVACGVYRASVVDDVDPLGQRRLRVRVPDSGGGEPVWAEACLQAPDGQPGPAVGDEVWVAYEAGDLSRPVWLGHRVTG
jgi:hypothetical protein